MPGPRRLRASGYTARSAYLTSPTFGGSSWLAHATLQSGLPVSDQGRYDQLLASNRTTLSSAFARAGWRTVAVLPSTRGTWPEGQAFYGFDQVYGRSRPRLRRAEVRLLRHARPVRPVGVRTSGARCAAPRSGHGRGRAHLEPRAVGAAPDDGRPRSARRRVGLRRHPGGCRHRGSAVERSCESPCGLPDVDPLLPVQCPVVRGAARRRRPRGRPPRRPPAVDGRERRRGEPGRARHGRSARTRRWSSRSRAGVGRAA